jgi:hypothetical protein
MRSNSLRRFTISPWRTPSVRSPDEICETTKYSSPQNSFTFVQPCDDSYELSIIDSLHCSLTEFECLSFLRFLTTLSLRKRLLARTPCCNSRTLLSAEIPSTLCTPVVAILQRFAQNRNSETLLGLCTPCTAPIPNSTGG